MYDSTCTGCISIGKDLERQDAFIINLQTVIKNGKLNSQVTNLSAWYPEEILFEICEHQTQYNDIRPSDKVTVSHTDQCLVDHTEAKIEYYKKIKTNFKEMITNAKSDILKINMSVNLKKNYERRNSQ